MREAYLKYDYAPDKQFATSNFLENLIIWHYEVLSITILLFLKVQQRQKPQLLAVDIVTSAMSTSLIFKAQRQPTSTSLIQAVWKSLNVCLKLHETL